MARNARKVINARGEFVIGLKRTSEPRKAFFSLKWSHILLHANQAYIALISSSHLEFSDFFGRMTGSLLDSSSLSRFEHRAATSKTSISSKVQYDIPAPICVVFWRKRFFFFSFSWPKSLRKAFLSLCGSHHHTLMRDKKGYFRTSTSRQHSHQPMSTRTDQSINTSTHQHVSINTVISQLLVILVVIVLMCWCVNVLVSVVLTCECVDVLMWMTAFMMLLMTCGVGVLACWCRLWVCVRYWCVDVLMSIVGVLILIWCKCMCVHVVIANASPSHTCAWVSSWNNNCLETLWCRNPKFQPFALWLNAISSVLTNSWPII
jgi:hypothetical protein